MKIVINLKLISCFTGVRMGMIIIHCAQVIPIILRYIHCIYVLVFLLLCFIIYVLVHTDQDEMKLVLIKYCLPGKTNQYCMKKLKLH